MAYSVTYDFADNADDTDSKKPFVSSDAITSQRHSIIHLWMHACIYNRYRRLDESMGECDELRLEPISHFSFADPEYEYGNGVACVISPPVPEKHLVRRPAPPSS